MKTLGFAVAIFAILLGGCGSSREVRNVYSPEEWRQLLDSAGGWTPLPIPDSKYNIGSIIQVNNAGIRWLGDLDACGFPMDKFSKPGQIPAVTFKNSKSFSVNALLNYRGIDTGPEFNKVNGVLLNVSDHSAVALNLIALRVWQELPENFGSVSDVCFDELDKPDRYLITEAFTVSQAEYTLLDETGAMLELSASMLERLLNVEAGADYSVTADGKLAVTTPTVFGIRNAMRIDNSFQVLRDQSGQPEVADAKIEAIYQRAHSP